MEFKTWCASVYSRITLTRFTTLFFVFSLLHCLTQGIIQSFLFSIDHDQRSFLNAVVSAGTIPAQNTTFLEGDSGSLHLQICSDIPYGHQATYPCTTVFNSTIDANSNNQSTRVFDWHSSPSVTVSPVIDSKGNVILQSSAPGAIFLSRQCVQTLVHPQQRLTNFQREDITFVALQFWLFGISVFAVANDSVPHILSVVITRILVTAWSIYAVWRAKYDEATFTELLASPGTPCSLDVFTPYFAKRLPIQIADMVLTVVALFIAVYLSLILLRTYSSQAFKCVGAPPHIQRINKFFLALLACLQLEVFILVAGMSMWIDVLLNTAIAKISVHTPEYIAVFITSAVLLLPWIIMGWYAIKREKKVFTIAFLVIGLIFIIGWSVMFYSIVYRWTFTQWPFLGCFTVSSLVLLTASMLLGGICRLNFGKGHAEYLYAEATLASQNFTKEVFTHNEKEEPFDLIEPGKVYYVQTRETSSDADAASPMDVRAYLPQLSKSAAPFDSVQMPERSYV